MIIKQAGSPPHSPLSDLAAGLLLAGVGVTGLWAASSGFDQTLGSIGLFESLSYAAGSLDDVEWWGVPWFEVVCVVAVIVAIVVGLVRVVRRRPSRVGGMLLNIARVFCWFGVWMFAMSLVASMRSGQGLPALSAWTSGTSLLACVAAVVVVDLGFYVEHRLRHALRLSSVGRPDADRFGVWSVVVEVVGSVVTAVVLSLVGFELLVIAVARLLIEVYRIAVRAGVIPAAAGVVLMTSSDAHSHDDSASRDAVGFGGVFSIWDRLGRTRQSSSDRHQPGPVAISGLVEVTS